MTHKLSIVVSNTRYDIWLQQIKILTGNNYFQIEKIMQTMCDFFNKLPLSEYSIENDINSYLLFDDEKINLSDFDFFNITENFSLETELKLNTKSIFLLYLNALLDDVEYNETFQTIDILLQTLIDEFTVDFNIDDFSLNIDTLFNKKELIKLCSIKLLKNGLEINDYDLTSKDKIILQLNILKKYSEHTKKNLMVLLRCHILTSDIMQILNDISGYIIVVPDKTTEVLSNFYFIDNDMYLDIMDENMLFNICENYTSYQSIETMKEILIRDHLEKIRIT